ncbi:MAG: VPA1262 family protein [Pseudomonadota bacterium]
MQGRTHKDTLAPILEDLLNDNRLSRLFSQDARHCALQLWILQIQSEQSLESRVLYGRLLPYNHSSDSWSASDDDDFQAFGQVQAQVIRINLYVKSIYCADLLRQLSAGRTILAISEELKFGLTEKLKARFGSVAFVADNLGYRPVAYLLNRDAYDRHSPSSPHGGAGAISASISQANKTALFRLGQDYDVALTSSVVKHLNADTGLDFAGADTTRFGDLELLVFPALDDMERQLLSVSWAEGSHALIARFNPMQVPYFSIFQFRLSITNDSQVSYSGIAIAEADAEGIFESKFELSDQLRSRVDSAELEVFGFHNGNSREGTLCCRWQGGYIREIHLQGHVGGRNGANPVKFDWLEKATRASAAPRVQAALTITRGNLGFTNIIGGRQADPWVPANRALLSLFSRLHPLKSEGCFFQRWSLGDGEGRLQFVEWFKGLLAKYKEHQVVVFDPYFETAGLGLLLLCSEMKTDYIVFTSLPKPAKEDMPTLDEPDKLNVTRLNNLVLSCEQNRHQLTRLKLRIYGLKKGRLHDRYILIIGADKLPVAGFNLSNSFQKAAENYPLLVTPIPADILLKVEQYKSGLVREAEAVQSSGETDNPSMQLLFDSSASPTAPRRYEPLHFLERTQAGNVLSVWVGEPALQALSSDALKERMVALGLLKNDSLTLPEAAGLRNYLDQQTSDCADFMATWEVIGEVLAHSRTEEERFCELESKHGFLELLARYLERSFNRGHDEMDKELAVIAPQLFRNTVEDLLHSSYRPHHLFHAIKYAGLTWPEYFAVKLLWRHSPEALLTIAEDQVVSVSIESQNQDRVRLSLLSQIVSEIALSMQCSINEIQRDRLLLSGNGLLYWLGLNAIEMQLERPEGLSAVLQLASSLSHPQRVQVLGWLVHRAARNPERAEVYKGLVAGLRDALPAMLSASELKFLIDTMRGHMRQLSWVGPWLFQDIVFPLLQDGHAQTDDACEIWMQELIGMLEPQPNETSRLFDSEREGQTTNLTAFLMAHSSSERQQTSLLLLGRILRRQQRIVQQPLASTSDWTRWNGALTVSLWVLAFSKWVEYYLNQRGMVDSELERLSLEARKLAMVRPVAEWRVDGTGQLGQLAAFLDQAEALLVASDELSSGLH